MRARVGKREVAKRAAPFEGTYRLAATTRVLTWLGSALFHWRTTPALEALDYIGVAATICNEVNILATFKQAEKNEEARFHSATCRQT